MNTLYFPIFSGIPLVTEISHLPYFCSYIKENIYFKLIYITCIVVIFIQDILVKIRYLLKIKYLLRIPIMVMFSEFRIRESRYIEFIFKEVDVYENHIKRMPIFLS